MKDGPKYVIYGYFCHRCEKLKSLEGAPENIPLGMFSCGECEKLTSLKGCPKNVGRYFGCAYCGNKFTITDVEKYCNVRGSIIVWKT